MIAKTNRRYTMMSNLGLNRCPSRNAGDRLRPRAGGSLFAACVGEVHDGLLPDAPVTVVMTDEERAAAYNAASRGRGTPPLPQWFRELPVEEQLRRWQAARDRGDHEPARDGEADGGLRLAGDGLPYGLRELGKHDLGAAVDDDGPLF